MVHFLSDTWDDEDMYLYTSHDFSWCQQRSTDEDTKSLSSLTSEPPTPDCNEGTLSWIPKTQVLSLNLWEGDHLFLEKLIANEDFGELTVRYEGDTLVAVR